MYTFENLYNRYQEYFIYKHGQAKFNTIKEKIHNSSKLADLNKQSIQNKAAPPAAVFGASITTTPYFIFCSADTSALAEFIAIKNWNEGINSVHNFCTDRNLLFMGEDIIRRWRIRL